VPQIDVERLETIRLGLIDVADRLDAMGRRMDRAIRDSDRRAEEYLPILRRAGIVPSRDVPRRRRPWWW